MKLHFVSAQAKPQTNNQIKQMSLEGLWPCDTLRRTRWILEIVKHVLIEQAHQWYKNHKNSLKVHSLNLDLLLWPAFSLHPLTSIQLSLTIPLAIKALFGLTKLNSDNCLRSWLDYSLNISKS